MAVTSLARRAGLAAGLILALAGLPELARTHEQVRREP